MQTYYRPIVQTDAHRPPDAQPLAGGKLWFNMCEALSRKAPPRLIQAGDIPPDSLARLTAPRAPLMGLTLDKPRIMGVLNVTPDSFSDGGLHNDRVGAIARALTLAKQGADIIDIGGESTRPGAVAISPEVETARTIAVIAGLKLVKSHALISIDTRKASIARAAFDAGAVIFNDVSALSFDAQSIDFVRDCSPSVCLMHSMGEPQTMQDDPRYDDVVLDVYDYLAARVQVCLDAGLSRGQIIVDVGVGFGKTLAHNLALLRGMAVFHGLGCGVMLGVSRKRMIGVVSGVESPADRVFGSVAVAQDALAQGVQIIRCHDVAEHRQAFDLWERLVISGE